MDARFDPWERHQPKYESLVMLADDRFALTVRLPSGEMIEVPLGTELPPMPFGVDEPEP